MVASKHFSHINACLLATTLSVIFIAGCKKETFDNSSAITYLSEKNILVFKSINDLEQRITSNLKNKGNVIQETAVEFPGFLSMKKIFDTFDKEEVLLVEKLPDSVRNPNTDWRKYLRLSDISTKYKKTILVKQFSGNREYYYDMNIGQRHFADLY